VADGDTTPPPVVLGRPPVEEGREALGRFVDDFLTLALECPEPEEL
jgi:hypothetical protein